MTRHVTLLWHGDEPIGICVFTTPPRALRQRSRYFGLRGGWSRVRLQTLNRQIALLARVVIHPTYRGAGIAAAFVRESCRSCRWPWIESLAQMGHIHPFFEKAGFQRVGVSGAVRRDRRGHSAIYGAGRTGVGRKRHGQTNLVSRETYEKSRYAEPVYYLFDNRPRPDAGAS